MTREELKAHCERQVQQFERVEKIMPVTLNDWKRYEEHKLVLELLEQETRKGHWIKGYTFPDGEYWKCDKCNELIKVKYPMHYCNNCGSDNREVEDV